MRPQARPEAVQRPLVKVVEHEARAAKKEKGGILPHDASGGPPACGSHRKRTGDVMPISGTWRISDEGQMNRE